jgi:AcrR family transcriptional regulator
MSAHPTSAANAPRPLRADARRNRERIVEAARKVFAEQGSVAQVDDIARAAGVGVGTVYRHFPHKDALMAELVAAKFRAFADNAERALEVDDPWDAFAGLLRTNAGVCARDLAVQQALAGEPAAWALAEEEFQRLRGVTEQLIRRAQAAGVMRPDFEVDEIPMLVCGLSATMGIAGYDWRRHLEIILDGLRVPASAPAEGVHATP